MAERCWDRVTHPGAAVQAIFSRLRGDLGSSARQSQQADPPGPSVGHSVGQPGQSGLGREPGRPSLSLGQDGATQPREEAWLTAVLRGACCVPQPQAGVRHPRKAHWPPSAPLLSQDGGPWALPPCSVDFRNCLFCPNGPLTQEGPRRLGPPGPPQEEQPSAGVPSPSPARHLATSGSSAWAPSPEARDTEVSGALQGTVAWPSEPLPSAQLSGSEVASRREMK